MGQHYLKQLFEPQSVVVFGASDRPDAVGALVFKNMLESGFKGDVYPINVKRDTVQGQKAIHHWKYWASRWILRLLPRQRRPCRRLSKTVASME